MNPFDLVVALLVVVAIVFGYRSGALPQIGGLAGALAGGGFAFVALPPVVERLGPLEPTIRAIAVLAGLLLSVGIGEAIGSALGRLAASSLGRGLLGALDRVAGAFVGAAQALLIVWLAGGLLAAGPSPRIASIAQGSVAVRALDRLLPPLGEISNEFGRLLDASGLPDVFVGLEPLPAPPVDRPNDPAARAIAANAIASTVRVSAQTCGLLSSGTGFVVAPGYVVTNAHVVAGERTVRVNLAGSAHDAVPVLFDPELDVAVLRAPTLTAAPLRFATVDPERGAIGAALGYPGGGALSVVPAAVAGQLDARGRDIYDVHVVTRTILELRAAIDRGDSGGPLVLADGTVGGVVFAESRTNEDVGYALSGPSVATAVMPALGRTAEVDTGPCLH